MAVPYLRIADECILGEQSTMTPNYLATWRGNTASNSIRSKIVELYKNDNSFDIYVKNGRSNYTGDEKRSYVTSLLKAKFSLCPAGFAPVSFRIFESMALGRCPIIIADQFIPPQGPEWETFSIFIPEKQIDKIKSILKQNETFYNDLGRKAFENWKKYFSPSNCDRYYVTKLIELIKLSPITTVQDEVNRWSSISTYYNNKWTLPQRFYNKLSKS